MTNSQHGQGPMTRLAATGLLLALGTLLAPLAGAAPVPQGQEAPANAAAMATGHDQAGVTVADAADVAADPAIMMPAIGAPPLDETAATEPAAPGGPGHRVPRELTCKCPRRVRCFQTVSDCRSGRNVKVLSDPRQCIFNASPIYQCEGEEPARCRTIDNCQPVEQGSGKQDPHMKGFNGADYYFGGHAGRVYSIVSDRDFALNAQFTRLDALQGTYMNRLGMRVGRDIVAFHPHFGVFVNGDKLAARGRRPYALDEGRAHLLVDHLDGTHRLTLKTDTWQVSGRAVIESGRATMADAYINVGVSLHARPVNPHGILGQTALFMVDSRYPSHVARGFRVEGEEDDYEVHDGLFGTRHRFNRFVEVSTPADSAGSATRVPGGLSITERRTADRLRLRAPGGGHESALESAARRGLVALGTVSEAVLREAAARMAEEETP
ncbi:hypothetical protein H696_05827 [Fonticula alba]|uniref:VWFD domain-containing protein n=1 Tax=Fonticula alba TaxID=691883 RepID=A0A058Z0B9_FONAL|nr:hypothetical protein H696_05827 [Fonticula alba]KCV67719.1 hypothetical protein H696_05827 [Fonticula alba]|eukprot:XP_009497903.1 hypothetical protein H696_05827 [Fonticula alba]